MNNGIIVGRVYDRNGNPAKKALVSVVFPRQFEVFDLNDEPVTRPRTYANNDGVFELLFRWQGHDIGEISAHQMFAAYAYHKTSNHLGRGKATGKLVTGPSFNRLRGPLTMSNMGYSGLLELAGKKLASAMLTAGTPQLSTEEWLAAGICVIRFSSKR